MKDTLHDKQDDDIWSWDFTATKFDEVFSGCHPRQLSVSNRRFDIDTWRGWKPETISSELMTDWQKNKN